MTNREPSMLAVRDRWLERAISPLDHDAVRWVYKRLAQQFKRTAPIVEFASSPRACLEAWGQHSSAVFSLFYRRAYALQASHLKALQIRQNSLQRATMAQTIGKPLWRAFTGLDALNDMGFREFGTLESPPFTSIRTMLALAAEYEAFVSLRRVAIPRADQTRLSFAWHCGDGMEGDGRVVMSERPTLWQRDDFGRSHADGQPALRYGDGSSVWAWHGVILTNPRYRIPSTQWASAWLLDESDARLRRALLEVRGVDRLLSELNASQIDAWEGYALLRVNAPSETWLFVTMTDPDSRRRFARRVPPWIGSAQAGIQWINRGVEINA
jgi:hypothetical protein